MGRVASLVLVSPAGELLGMLPPLELAVPYWQEVADLVAGVRERFGARVVVLRLLHTEPESTQGGRVAYLGELTASALSDQLLPVPEPLRELAQARDAKRMPWAELGGPARSLDWARAALPPSERSDFNAIQQRTWNLSSLWRLEPPSPSGTSVWLKQMPHFMRYESRVLGWLNRVAPDAAPRLVAADDDGRSLLAHVPGSDLYGASVAVRHQILDQLHVVQGRAVAEVGELLASGVPDMRGAAPAADIREKLLAWDPDYPGLEALLRDLDPLVESLEGCGLPATLVHADNHPGNARSSARGVVLLDWGEAFIGNPVTDLLGLTGGLSPAEAEPLRAHWCEAWRTLAPGSNPERALELAPQLGALHGAATYASFLQQIEASEWPYHRRDVPRCLAEATALLKA